LIKITTQRTAGKSTAGRRQKSAKRSAYTQRNNLNDKIKNNAKTTARTTISCGNNTATRLGESF
jgi:hypothetical protein